MGLGKHRQDMALSTPQVEACKRLGRPKAIDNHNMSEDELNSLMPFIKAVQ